jgi:hypothetical protein
MVSEAVLGEMVFHGGKREGKKIQGRVSRRLRHATKIVFKRNSTG